MKSDYEDDLLNLLVSAMHYVPLSGRVNHDRAGSSYVWRVRPLSMFTVNKGNAGVPGQCRCAPVRP